MFIKGLIRSAVAVFDKLVDANYGSGPADTALERKNNQDCTT